MRSMRRSLLKALALGGVLVSAGHGIDFDARSVTQWSPYLEWEIKGVSWSGNAYDVVATVTFEHAVGDGRHETEMFFDGNGTWKFRFTGTHTGTWTFTTKSDNADLNGHGGEVTVTPNPDESVTGFLVSSGNKFAVQTGEDGKLKAVPGHIFFPFGRDAWQARPDILLENLDEIMQKNEKYGFHRYFMSEVCNGWFKLGARGWNDHTSEEPDRATFEALEQVITNLHERGHSLHIWAWGDEARRWSPRGVPGGLNGHADRRVQRYIAARLGPLPNWTMGYGFDLQEWVTESELESWAEYLHRRMGWPHLLWARGRSNSELDVRSFSHVCHSYDNAVSNLSSDRNRPQLFEERDLYLRSCADMNWTRNHLWRYTLAGGHAGFFGQKFTDKKEYPNPEQVKTFFTFWNENDRLLPDMQRAANPGNGYCLTTSGGTHAVFYTENTSSMEMDLSEYRGTLFAVAVDVKRDYEEIPLTVEKADMTWNAPHSSDWAVAVGEFEDNNPTALTPGVHQHRVAPVPLKTFSTRNRLCVTGLHPDRPYAVTLTDARGRVSSVWKVSDTDGTASISTTTWSRGIYLVTVRGYRGRKQVVGGLSGPLHTALQVVNRQ